ncbi:MAG: hypothetical protein DELT_00583 [Desulfovibrio sp.]
MIPIFLIVVSVAVLFLIEANKAKRTNEFGVEQYKTATGAVLTGYFSSVAARIARICLVVGVLWFALPLVL